MKSTLKGFIKRVRQGFTLANIHRQKIWQTILIGAGLGMSLGAAAQSSSGGGAAIFGLCKITSFISDTLAFAVAGVAVAIMGTLYTMDAAREGVMSSAVRILLGAGVAIAALTLVGFALGKSVC